MENLVKEFYNIQNQALSAYLLSRFSLGYMEENQDMAPMPLLFIVLPMMYKKEIVDFIASTQKKSGLRFFADKFTEKKNSNKGLDSPNSKYQSTIQGNDIRSYWNWDVWKII